MSNRRRAKPVTRRFDHAEPHPRSEPRTFWNGEETRCERGTAIVAAPTDGQFPDYWAADLVGNRVAVVRVDYHRHVSWLYDGDGSGWRKVTTGRGSPRYGHKNVVIEKGSWVPGG